MDSEIVILLNRANARGIYFFIDDKKVKVNVNIAFITDEEDRALIEQIRKKKTELLKLLKTNGLESRFQTEAISIQERPEHILMSYGQERIWFIDQLEGSVHYHIPWVVRIRGDLNPNNLEMSFKAVLRRHEVLRTVIEEQDGRGYQKVLLWEGWALEYFDEQALDEQELPELISSLIERPFDLSMDYMLRAALINVGRSEQVLIINIHHISFDAWSWNVFIKELNEQYLSLSERRPAVQPELPIQYIDYAIWQRSFVSEERQKSQLQYWIEQLRGVAPLELPTDYPRQAIHSTAGDSVYCELDAELLKPLRALSERQGVSMFMVCLSALKLLLNRYSHQTDICVGTPMAGRSYTETENLIGFFVNTIVLRSDLSADPLYTAFLRSVRDTTLEGYDHQEVPFEKVVDHTVTDRDMSRSPLFQVMFLMQNDRGSEDMRLGYTDIVTEPLQGGRSKFDLTFTIVEGSDTLGCNIEYCSDLYRKDTIERMLRHYGQLLKSIADHPDKRVSELEMLTPEEYYQVTEGFNATAHDYPRDKTVIDLFTEQAQRHPEATALVFGDKELSYGELDARSSRLAHYLREKGVQEDSLVCLCIERSVEMIIGILGVMKAGGAYVPIDPGYPKDRVEYILNDTGSTLVVSSEQSKSSVPANYNGEVISLDNPEVITVMSGYAPVRLVTVLTVKNLAYVIYTSGSTGKPKGVMVSIGNITSFIESLKYILGMKSGMRVAAVTNYTFDISVLELLGTLTIGASIYLLRKNDSDSILTLIEKARINFLQITPSHLKQVIQVNQNYHEILKNLQVLLIGGETLDESITDKLKNYLNTVKILNVYGPTETTIWSTSGEINKCATGSVGRPLLNETIYIIDNMKRICPIGVPGQIYIGGTGVSIGYHNKNELTSEKYSKTFSFSSHRLYQTGDWGKWTKDGEILFLGRRDNQIKLSGYRIEIDEIEACIANHPQIGLAAVIAKQNDYNESELLCYYTSIYDLSRKDLYEFLKVKLPKFMIPHHFIKLASFPLNSSHKIDRTKLKKMKSSKSDPSYNSINSLNDYEKAIYQIWIGILGHDNFIITDTFFSVGGDSFKLIRLHNEINKRYPNVFALVDLFDLNTIRLISLAIMQNEHPDNNNEINI